jgi:alpha-glucoside transport system permease protein
MQDRIILAAIVVVGVPLVLFGYITLIEGLLRTIPGQRQTTIRPWLWLGPCLAFLLFYWIYPALETLRISFLGPNSENVVGLANYQRFFTDLNTLSALKNNVIWLIFATGLTVGLGLVIAVLTDRVPYESLAKALVFLPMAISMVAAGVIWRFMYTYQPPGQPQTGTLNAFVTALGGQPQAWLVNQPLNTFAMIFAFVWMWTGFCMVILSAALKGISTEILEAARVDGATELQVFRGIIVPMLGPTLAVVTTTMAITVLKLFDLVYVMTNGNFDTEVIANRMYKEMFNVHDFGRASSIAIVLLLAIVPVMLFNLRQFRAQEAIR